MERVVRVQIAFMQEGSEVRSFTGSPRVTAGELRARYFKALNNQEDTQFYGLFFKGQPLEDAVTLCDARFGDSVSLVVKEAPELKRAGVTVTAVNALTGARECVEHCLVIHTGIAQCADVTTAGESEA